MGKRHTVSHLRTTGLVLVSLGWALFLALIGSPEAILFTVPVFLLAAPLAFGFFPGEDLIESLRAARPKRRVTAPSQLLQGREVRIPVLIRTGNSSGRGPPVPSF